MMNDKIKCYSARRLLPTTLLERWPQVCRFKITFELLLNNWFVSTRTNLMKCFVNWIPANSHFYCTSGVVVGHGAASEAAAGAHTYSSEKTR